MLLHVNAGWHLWQHQRSFSFTLSSLQCLCWPKSFTQPTQTSPELRILPSSQFFCSLWSFNYIFFNAVLSSVVVQRSFKAGSCACAAAPASVNQEENNVSYLLPLSLLTSLFWGLVATLGTHCCHMNLVKIIEIELEASGWLVSLVNENIPPYSKVLLCSR